MKLDQSFNPGLSTDAHGSTRMTRFRCSRGRSPRTIPGDVPPKVLPTRFAVENAERVGARHAPGSFPKHLAD